MKESLEKAIYPRFVAKWKQEQRPGRSFHFVLCGSETVTNQILQGVPAEIAILSIERDAQRLKDGNFVTSDWRALAVQRNHQQNAVCNSCQRCKPERNPRLSGSCQAGD